ncbi:serine/threonine protein kinase [Nocardiopsis algeriensis]|uniref:non-specific serine/threonine protein kinase n=1 Tax=Nocardiopsis algeriensis TaxID=1478215 RepID=A0A841INH6_9ACTN|nr:serine/threonine-protein kinase [Nocardiopsis algeriensis]MBB6119644.1 hypothetical protein [Nocardiopsis algeriensis]
MADPQGGNGTAESPRVVGDYQLVRSLGRGGFGEVFLGEAPDGSRAAVKMLHASWAGDADMRRRFAAEVEQARKVSGFCVAEILAADPDAPRPWIATEYIDGPTLHDFVQEKGPRSGSELHRLAVSTATALAAIHAAGVVHRDLKPENIMLAADGPRVIDFGIARAVESTSVTASGVVGTIGYMAPEQLEGIRLTPAVDIFSWGSVMVYAATGHEAFPGPTQASRIARILGGQPELGGLPEPLLQIVGSCLDKDPRRRPEASALLDLLISGGGTRTGVRQAAATLTAPPEGLSPTRVAPAGGIDPTRVAPAEGVDPTRVAPPGGVFPTTSYTGGETGQEGRAPAPGMPPPSGSPSWGEPPTPSGAAVGGRPPYHFDGIRFTDPGSLAEAMQSNWSMAVRVFGDPVERAALGAWLVDDLGDTTVDRSLFRRAAGDANLSLASFVAQLRPDLPPVFRGRGATVAELREIFTDPRPVLTGEPVSNEMALLARPAVLRTMALHRGVEQETLRRLADQLDSAERAGSAFREELTGQLAGWKAAGAVNPVLVLTFLLHPERMLPPAASDPGAQEWVDILWQRVSSSPEAEAAGYAAVVYTSLPLLQTLARERRYWEERFAKVSSEHEALAGRVAQQQQMTRIRRYCNLALWGFPAGMFLHMFSSLFLEGSWFPALIGDLLILLSVLGLAATAVLSIVLRVGYGNLAVRNQRLMELTHVGSQLPQLTSGVERIRGDLATARRITGG